MCSKLFKVCEFYNTIILIFVCYNVVCVIFRYYEYLIVLYKMSHSILFVQSSRKRPETKTYTKYETVNECMEGENFFFV